MNRETDPIQPDTLCYLVHPHPMTGHVVVVEKPISPNEAFQRCLGFVDYIRPGLADGIRDLFAKHSWYQLDRCIEVGTFNGVPMMQPIACRKILRPIGTGSDPRSLVFDAEHMLREHYRQAA
jgi:hypothetical protein